MFGTTRGKAWPSFSTTSTFGNTMTISGLKYKTAPLQTLNRVNDSPIQIGIVIPVLRAESKCLSKFSNIAIKLQYNQLTTGIRQRLSNSVAYSRSATEQLLLEVQDKANGLDVLDLNDISGGVVTSIIGQLGLDNGIEMVRAFLSF